ncbi:DHA2 family efflux MFS transporter permease subunit [Virgisporangium aurantiacum]|uniref:MFS transporter n=1 Tax=Virgisporangium aurantiacum TaxID=175570 RepID=A0A8J3Z1W1_9ACTN|nr:DHA2 family efflux MFS transporter permease subunit [Virgisporangium aurantiacum]GIJ54768.1 MFS transporter [Virgisporangium aurantiacum]
MTRTDPTTAGTAAVTAAARQGALTHRQILTILAGLQIGMFLAALDQMILATAIRTIADDLSGLRQEGWTLTTYLVAMAATTPLYGKLSDIHGRKPMFLIAISVFMVGSVACTFAMSMDQLALARGLQGLGAGGLISLGLAIIADIVPARERGRYQGYLLAIFVTSSVLGPVIGGVLAGQPTILGITGWRWVFLVNVPVGLVALVVVAKVLNVQTARRSSRVDWLGSVTLVATLVPLLLVVERGRLWGWGSLESLACLAVVPLGFAAWLAASRRAGDDALIPLRLFRSGEFSRFCGLGLIYGISLFTGSVIIPQYLQIVRNASPMAAGLMVLPLVVAMVLASLLVGRLMSRSGRYKRYPIVGMALVTASLVLFAFGLDASTPLVGVMLLMCVYGVGLGCCIQTLTVATQNAVPMEDIGVATGAASFVRQFGLMSGTAVLFSILFHYAGTGIAGTITAALGTDRFRAALADPAVTGDPANAPILDAVGDPANAVDRSGVLNDSSFLHDIDPRLAQPFQEGFANSMEVVFAIAACVAAVGFVLSLLMKELPLRKVSAHQARASAAAEEVSEEPEPAAVR